MLNKNTVRQIVLKEDFTNLFYKDDILSRQKFSLFRLFSFTGALVSMGVFTKMVFMFESINALHCVLPLISIIMMVNFYGVKKLEQLNHAYVVVLISAFLLLHVVSYSTGGIRSASVLYHPVVILYAFMLLGKKGGQYFSVLFIVHIVYVFFISRYTDLTSFSFLDNNQSHIEEDFLFNFLFMVFLITAHSNYLNSGRNIVLKKVTEQRDELSKKNNILKQTIANLEKSNQELDKFAYVVSHDLKAPLRAIGSVTGMLEEDMAEVMTNEGIAHINVIHNRVNRMEGLINGILNYSKMVRTVDEGEVIEMQEFLRTSLDLAGAADFCTLSGNFPLKVVTNKTKLQQVLQNIVGNAIKHCDKPIPMVKINVTNTEDCVQFSIKDNGPGIDEKYHHKVFVIFQTLKPRDEFESTGIGLSIVKRIVADRGGKVWVESDGKNGTTFHVVWPLKEIKLLDISELEMEQDPLLFIP